MDRATQHSPTFPLLVLLVCTLIKTFITGLIICPLLEFAIGPVLPSAVHNFLFFWPQLALAPFKFALSQSASPSPVRREAP